MTTPPRPTHPRQQLLLVIAAALIAIAVALVLVVMLRGGSDGPAAGSPDAVTDGFAAALRSHDAAGIRARTCAGDQADVARRLRGLSRELSSADRKGAAEVRGDVAVGLVALSTTAKAPGAMTVALRQVATTWCVTSIAISIPTHG